MALFTEVPQQEDQVAPERVSGANITVVGDGGGGKNAIKNLIEDEINPEIELVAIDKPEREAEQLRIIQFDRLTV